MVKTVIVAALLLAGCAGEMPQRATEQPALTGHSSGGIVSTVGSPYPVQTQPQSQ